MPAVVDEDAVHETDDRVEQVRVVAARLDRLAHARAKDLLVACYRAAPRPSAGRFEADVDGGAEVGLRLVVAHAVLVVEGGEDVVEVGLVEVRHAEAGGGGDVDEVVRGAVEKGRELFLEGVRVEDAAAAAGILHRRMVDERLRGALKVALGVFGPVLAAQARAD